MMKLDHLELLVPDRDAAMAWYGEWLGFEPVQEHKDWAATGPLMLTNDGGETMLALFAGPSQAEADDRGWRRLALRTDAVALSEFVIRYRPSGQPLEGPCDHGKAWSYYFTDPWGNRLEVTTYDYDPFAQSAEVAK